MGSDDRTKTEEETILLILKDFIVFYNPAVFLCRMVPMEDTLQIRRSRVC